MIFDKFDKHEKEGKAKDELLSNLQTQVTKFTKKVSNLIVRVHQQEQYSRQNCLLMHGLKESFSADTDKLSIQIINVNLKPSDIDRTHCIVKKGRVIIVKFAGNNIGKEVFMNKRMFKGTNIFVTKSLISLSIGKFKDPKNKCEFTTSLKSVASCVMESDVFLEFYFTYFEVIRILKLGHI